MHSRRSFIRDVSLGGLLLHWKGSLEAMTARLKDDASRWQELRELFPISRWEKIQFNSGSAGVMPSPIQDHLIELIQYVNSKAPYQVWSEWQPIKQENLSRLGKLIGSNSESLQIVRNTTEALNMVIYGLPLTKGDSVVICEHDYPFAKNAWLNRQQRDGIVLKHIEFQLPDSDEEIISAYANAIDASTKVIHITHMTHRQGHIMPVKALTEMAHEQGVEVVVDGAHVVGQIDVDLEEIQCDYFASSLHKWLNAPLGTGLLYVKPGKVESLFNHPSSNLDAYNSMNKYEHIGTRCWANEICISAALDFHEFIGHRAKTERLRELKKYWMHQVEEIPNVHFHTNMDDHHSCAVASFSIEGFSGGKITKLMDREYNIHAKSVGGRWGSGVRISVNVFTDFNDLNQLSSAIRGIAQG